jgi:hypothetical protein
MVRRSALVAMCLLFGASACAPFSADQGTDAAGLDGGSSADAGGEPDDAGATLPAVDGLDGGIEAGLDGCVPIVPLKVVTVASAAGAEVCNTDNVLARDGTVAGLDLKVGGVPVQIDNVNVTSCIGVDFGVPITSALIRMRSAGSACGTACSAACGKGDNARLFAGSAANALQYLVVAGTTSTLQTFKVSIPAKVGGQVVAVCRAGYLAANDDIEVESILGCR